MKKYLLLILLAPIIVFGQNTITPNSALQGQRTSRNIYFRYLQDFNYWSGGTTTRLIHSDPNISNGIINM